MTRLAESSSAKMHHASLCLQRLPSSRPNPQPSHCGLRFATNRHTQVSSMFMEHCLAVLAGIPFVFVYFFVMKYKYSCQNHVIIRHLPVRTAQLILTTQQTKQGGAGWGSGHSTTIKLPAPANGPTLAGEKTLVQPTLEAKNYCFIKQGKVPGLSVA